MVDIKCPKCGEKIGAMSIRQVRWIVSKLVKNIGKLGELDKKQLMAEMDRMEKEEWDECDECRAQIPADAKFCPQCGTEFEVSDSPQR